MLRLFFQIQKETYVIEVNSKEIFYKDRKLKRATRVIPVDPELQKKIIMSRNRLPTHLLDTFNLTKEEQIEYDNCKTEEELAEICKRDCLKNGSILIKREIIL
jgi:hypothetical protein